MKKLSKIFALIFAVLCLSVGLVACSEKPGVFNYDNCWKAYEKAGYTMTNIGYALNNYDLEKENSILYKAISKKDNDLAAKLYEGRDKFSRTGGFVATKGEGENITAVVVIQYKYGKTPDIEGFTNQLYGNYYSNIDTSAMANIYDWNKK